MNVTIDIKVLAIIVIAVAVVVLVAYIIQALKKLMVTLDHTNKILEDVEVVSEIAAERSKDIDGIITDVTGSVNTISETIKGQQSTLAALTSLVNAVASIKGIVNKKEK